MQLVRSLVRFVVCSCCVLIVTPLLAQQVDFQRDIRPILSDKCFTCHGPDAATREADLRLDLRDDAEAMLSAGDVEDSELIRRVESTDPDEQMPPPAFKNQVTPEQIDLLRRWIEQGANYESHWSFGPIEKSPLPDLPEGAEWQPWKAAAIDRFVGRRLLELGLQPSPRAPRAQWLRRVSFDLTGLPPTPEEVAEFLADERPEAAAEWVDRLLERQSYGERMASMWLDVARYSDTYGYQVDRDRYVWPWRDWVIRAFNDNLPYDQFLTWQIAGDLLPNPTRDQILATTFCRLHPQKVEGGSVPEEFRVEYVADRAHTVGTAFLGLTVECSRCHDHKYDPLTQRDYYQLFAYFNNIDEAGLYSYFTNSVPTPTLRLTSPQDDAALQADNESVESARRELESRITNDPAAGENWFATAPESLPIGGEVKRLDFEEFKSGGNTPVEGPFGNAVQLTGDDGIDVGAGNFDRSQPFSVSLWVWCPDVKDRAVIFHRSRAWTDAASRGYQLLIEDGRLSWSLIHFWPGNAISIQANDSLPLKTWTHVTVTYDGSSQASGLRIFVDGAAASHTVVRDQLYKNITGGGNDNITIGERFRDRGFTGGRVDEFALFDRELTELEVRQLADPDSWNQIRQQEFAALDLDTRQAISDYVSRVENEDVAEARKELQSKRKQRNDRENGLTEIMIMQELADRRPSFVLNRGAYDSPTTEVFPTTPEFLFARPNLSADRLGLAHWLTDTENPLTARVAVNRIWQMCFGNGLVTTPEDFGSQGALPTHPQLLDWLARDFIDNGWDQKRLLKQIVLSETYRQSSDAPREAWLADPDNQWLARGPRYRMPAEMIRDNALAVSGLLVDKVGGAPVKPYEVGKSFKPVTPDQGEGLYRRSLYTYWKRTAPAPVMLSLDAAKRDVCTVKRERTASPLQAIVLLNDPQLVEAARVLAEHLLEAQFDNDAERLNDLMLRLTGRPATELEIELLGGLWNAERNYYSENSEQAHALASIGHRPPHESLAAEQVAALTVVVSSAMNLDAAVIRR